MEFQDIGIMQKFIFDDHLFMKVFSTTTDINAVSLICGRCAHLEVDDLCTPVNMSFCSG